MTQLSTIQPHEWILLIGLFVACLTDITTRRIPNALNAALMVLGITVHATMGLGATFALTGLALAFAIHFLLWTLRVEKAGDAKLMMGVGALVGWTEMLESTLWMLILLIPAGLVMLAVSGRLENLRNTLMWAWMKAKGMTDGEPPPPTYMAYAPVIAVAVLVSLQSDWLDFAG